MPAEDGDDLALMRRIDALFMARPFLGSRRMAAMLRAEGITINRKRVQRLMQRTGIAALGPKSPAPHVTTVDPESSTGRQERTERRIHRLPQSLDQTLDAFEADEVCWFPPSPPAADRVRERCELTSLADPCRAARCRSHQEAYS